MSITSLSDQKSTATTTFSSYSFKTLLTDSFKILSRNKHLYIVILIFITLPLSFLHFNLCLSSHPYKSQIHHLENLASRAPTRFEARQVWRESREILLSLIHLKLISFIPIYVLSLIAAFAVVSTAESRYNRRPTSFDSVLTSFKANWTRPLLTSICVYVVLVFYSSVMKISLSIIGKFSVKMRFLMWVLGIGLENYVMGVLGLGLVVSIVEKRFGFAAISTGSLLMEGRRVSGWVLFGFLAVVTGGIGWRMEGLMMGGSEGLGAEMVVLMGVYAAVVIWGFVVITVFYCERRKRHVIRGEDEEEELQLQEVEESQEC